MPCRSVFRWLSPLLLWAIAVTANLANAESPPDLPLPACTSFNGMPVGACPEPSAEVGAIVTGRFTAGGAIQIKTDPAVPACSDSHDIPGNRNYSNWNPSPCYARVQTPVIEGCAYYDLRQLNGVTEPVFRHGACTAVLYRNPSGSWPGTASALFTASSPDGGGACGGAGNFQTFIYGAPANEPDQIWANRGPTLLNCSIKFNGPRPDGLLGPAWVKVNVSVGVATSGDYGRGPGRSPSSVIYVPIDGDMRDSQDVKVTGTAEYSRGDGKQYMTYRITAENLGSRDAPTVKLATQLNEYLHYDSADEPSCQPRNNPLLIGGGWVDCSFSLAGGATREINIKTRIIAVSDLLHAIGVGTSVSVGATVDGDVDTTNNHVDILAPEFGASMESGTTSDTAALMTRLNELYDYAVSSNDLYFKQCNVYMTDIYNQLEKLRAQHPEAFEGLSYGKITSGGYMVAGVYWSEGHVGVVVYKKGTDYMQTGIVIHGTPTNSPADRDPDTRLGQLEAGDQMLSSYSAQMGTSWHGQYYRTPIANFPGSPHMQAEKGCGFEGTYPDNHDEFPDTSIPSCGGSAAPDPAPATCPIPPDALVVETGSPVELLIQNALGQRVETHLGQISMQELDSGIFSWPVPHDDGTWAWTIALPKDDYTVQVVGVGDGPYTLKLTNFDPLGNAVVEEYHGRASPSMVQDYKIKAEAPMASGKSGNGIGSFGGSGLLVLGALAWRVRRRRATGIRA